MPKVTASCQAACTADGPKCQAFTYVTRPPLVGSCCLKASVPAPNFQAPTCTSGAKNPAPSTGAVADVPLLPGDAAVDVHIFVDNTFIEVFVMEGRAAFTASVTSHGAEAGAAGMELFASAPVQASAVRVYHLEGIWVSAPEVLASAGGVGR